MVLMIVLCSFVTKTRSKRQEYEKSAGGNTRRGRMFLLTEQNTVKASLFVL